MKYNASRAQIQHCRKVKCNFFFFIFFQLSKLVTLVNLRTIKCLLLSAALVLLHFYRAFIRFHKLFVTNYIAGANLSRFLISRRILQIPN